MNIKNAKEISINQVKINDLFWSEKQKLVTDVVIPYQEKILNDEVEGVKKSHAFSNFRIAAGLEDGDFYGMVFQDSDVAKWLEAVAYSLSVKPDLELEKRADEIIDIIEKAQQEDGYLNTYFTIKEPEHRWQNLQECHELYCAGHMMEAAAAYYISTGKDKLLQVMERMAENIQQQFGPSKRTGIPGHQEIEIGLMKLYHVTGKGEYKELAKYFIDERGKNPEFFKEEAKNRGWTHFEMDPDDTKYNQTYAPVREQKTAEGHSVRATYMYTAMADIARETNDDSLLEACDTIWDNIVNKRMYITGGIGSTVDGEAFSIDYDLPNDTVYAETCASIGLVFFAKNMLDIKPSNRYADVMERAIYNGVISGMQLDGKKFFYVNPLEVNPGISGKLHGFRHVLPERPGWYACACCPPNVSRLLTSLGKYAWSEGEDIIYSHLFIGADASFKNSKIKLESNYPWDGRVSYTVNPIEGKEKFTIAIRIPSYVKDAKVYVNKTKIDVNQIILDGYVYFERDWSKNDRIDIEFDMPVRRIYANTAVRDNAGCVALMRGPLVYCFEGVDNGDKIQELRIPEDAKILACKYEEELLGGIVPLELNGIRVSSDEALYSEKTPIKNIVKMKAVPYYTWGNRGLNQMRVWMVEE